jgi:hypothetical protein
VVIVGNILPDYLLELEVVGGIEKSFVDLLDALLEGELGR